MPAPAPPDPLVDALGGAAGSMTVTRDGGVVTIAFDRPEKRNAVSFAMWSAFARLMPAVADDEDVDVVVLRGTPGGPFSAGADIGEFRSLRAGEEGARRYGEAVAAGEQAIAHLPRPTVALVEGFAIGGGSEVALACDLRICDTGSRFGITPARLGLVYSLPSTARLVETVGAAWARWILLTGELLDAETALRIGLVHEVVAPGTVDARGAELVATLAGRARVSQQGAKTLVERAASGLRTEDDAVRAAYAASWTSAEYAEGVDAFLAKRAPDFAAARRRDRGPVPAD